MSIEMMGTREVAQYLHVKERKIYELVRDRRIPCVRVTGKWLFPRDLVDRWLADNTAAAGEGRPRPPVVAGSHDPLLEWCLREAECGLALMPGGSADGVARLAAGEAAVAGLHLYDAETGEYNVPALRTALAGADVVALQWAWREQGLVVAAGNPLAIGGLADLATGKARVVPRQPGSGSQVLFEHLLAQAGLAPQQLTILAAPARSETDVGLAVLEGRADCGPAIAAVARSLRLDFVPLWRERYDLVMYRRDYFEPPIQSLVAFTRTAQFAERAAAFGYDVGGLWRVVYNA